MLSVKPDIEFDNQINRQILYRELKKINLINVLSTEEIITLSLCDPNRSGYRELSNSFIFEGVIDNKEIEDEIRKIDKESFSQMNVSKIGIQEHGFCIMNVLLYINKWCFTDSSSGSCNDERWRSCSC